MGVKDIDTQHLTVTGAHKDQGGAPHVHVEDDVLIVVTQLFGPAGHNLIGHSEAAFDGFPAFTLLVKADGREGLVHLSPFHGDKRKSGFTQIPAGTKCELLCPASGEPLPHLGKVEENAKADYFALYLTADLSGGDYVAISDVWDDYHSRIVDNHELVSSYAVDG
jgi:hypothetical protein